MIRTKLKPGELIDVQPKQNDTKPDIRSPTPRRFHGSSKITPLEVHLWRPNWAENFRLVFGAPIEPPASLCFFVFFSAIEAQGLLSAPEDGEDLRTEVTRLQLLLKKKKKTQIFTLRNSPPTGVCRENQAKLNPWEPIYFVARSDFPKSKVANFDWWCPLNDNFWRFQKGTLAPKASFPADLVKKMDGFPWFPVCIIYQPADFQSTPRHVAPKTASESTAKSSCRGRLIPGQHQKSGIRCRTSCHLSAFISALGGSKSL